jgi:N-methylhydantoinase A
MKVPQPEFKITRESSPKHNSSRRGRIIFGGKSVLSTIYDREQLQPSKRYKGPAIVTEYSATTVIPPAKRFWLDPALNLIVDLKPRR